MNEKLKHISDFLPTLRELFDEEVFFTVVDTECIVQGFSLPKGVAPTLFVGDVMQDPTGAAQEVMRTGRPKRNYLPKEVMGAAYEGILAPIMDGAKVIGCIVCTHSVELQEQNAEIAARFQKDITDMNDHIGNVAGGIDDMSSLLAKISEIITKVEGDVKSATNVVKGINSNASTSHILSLNASIEAARAGGEAGKGFAVVANEMGRLSNASKRSADEIKKTLDLIIEHLTSIISSIKDADALADANREKIGSITDILTDTLELSEKLEKNIKS